MSQITIPSSARESLRHLSLDVAPVAMRDPKPVTTKVAQQVFEARPINDLIFTFMPINDQDRMKRVSQCCLAAAKRVQLVLVYQALPEGDLWRQYAGVNALKGVVIRNFPAPIQRPLSNYPARCMAGFEQTTPGQFSFYKFERHEFTHEARLPLLPSLTVRECIVVGLDARTRYLKEKENSCCTPSVSRGPGCLDAIRFISVSLFEHCCFKSALTIKFGWLTTWRENGGADATQSRAPLERKGNDLKNPDSKDKNV